LGASALAAGAAVSAGFGASALVSICWSAI
jgi:hypothetical protein